jgi:hypothetical protein
MQLEDIRDGDTVRLRDGRTVVVDSKTSMYRDLDGDHEGPFVTTRPALAHHPLAEVVEVVERNERVCRFCGEGVTSTNPEIDYCRGCHYTGRAAEAKREALLFAVRSIPDVTDASVWHTGGGCFLLAVTAKDGRFISVSDEDANVPEPGEPWQLLVVSPDQATWDEWDEDRLDVRHGEWTDAQLTVEIARVLLAVDDTVVDLDAERQYREEFRCGRDPRD